MLQIVLLAGKFAFLIILYLFIFAVVRSTTRELRRAAPAAKQQWAEATAQHAAVTAGPAPGGVPADGAWTIVVERSPNLTTGAAYAFPGGSHALAGRSSDMDIRLDDTFVSYKHALFESTPGGLVVEDLRSTNGTQVNGADIDETRLLQVGDAVQVGDTIFRVEVR